MAESIMREAFRETASALRLNRPVLAIIVAVVAFVGGWQWTGQPTWGGLIALAAALVLFVPLYLWNLAVVFGRRFAALQSSVGLIASSASGQEQVEAAREIRERRRKIIDDARKMVAQHEINKDRNWPRTIQISPAFAAVRPHLSEGYRKSLNSRSTVVTGREIHEISVDNFVSELDRLERQWGLS